MEQERAESNQYFDLSMLKDRSNFVFLSMLPWIPFTAVDHTMSLRKEDGCPRITWGKFIQRQDRTFLPYNIQVNHIFIDGYHIGKFYEILQHGLKTLGSYPFKDPRA